MWWREEDGKVMYDLVSGVNVAETRCLLVDGRAPRFYLVLVSIIIICILVIAISLIFCILVIAISIIICILVIAISIIINASLSSWYSVWWYFGSASSLALSPSWYESQFRVLVIWYSVQWHHQSSLPSLFSWYKRQFRVKGRPGPGHNDIL